MEHGSIVVCEDGWKNWKFGQLACQGQFVLGKNTWVRKANQVNYLVIIRLWRSAKVENWNNNARSAEANIGFRSAVSWGWKEFDPRAVWVLAKLWIHRDRETLWGLLGDSIREKKQRRGGCCGLVKGSAVGIISLLAIGIVF